MNDKLPLARLHRKFMMNFLRKKNCDSSRYSTIRRFVFQKKKRDNIVNKCKVTIRAPAVSHLLFADDIAHSPSRPRRNKMQGSGRFCRILRLARDRLLSEQKCSIMFSASVLDQAGGDIKHILHIEQEDFEAKCLVLRTPEGRMKNEKFQPLVERLGKLSQIGASAILHRQGKKFGNMLGAN